MAKQPDINVDVIVKVLGMPILKVMNLPGTQVICEDADDVDELRKGCLYTIDAVILESDKRWYLRLKEVKQRDHWFSVSRFRMQGAAA